MEQMKLYRVINPLDEEVGVETDAVSRPLSPRINRTLELSPVFDVIIEFWKSTGVQLATAVQAVTLLPLYFSQLEFALNNKDPYLRTNVINTSETISFVPTDSVRMLGLQYLQSGIKMQLNEGLFIWEYLWNLTRQSKYANCVSRYNCLFAFENREDAELYLAERIRENPSYAINKICNVEVIHVDKMEIYDMRWLDNIAISATYAEYLNFVDNYWSGTMTDKPLKEVLFQGIYKII